MIDIDTGLILDEDGAERVTRGQHRGRVGVETEHGHGLVAAIHADQRFKPASILSSPDGDVTRTRGAELFEVQATLIEVPIRGEALPRSAGGIGLVLVDAEETRAELDDASGGDVAVELRGRVITREPEGFARTRRAEAEMGVDGEVTVGDQAAARDGEGIELARSAAQALVGPQGVDGGVIPQERVSRGDGNLGGDGVEADREGAAGHGVFEDRHGTETVQCGVIEEVVVAPADHPRIHHAVGDRRSGSGDEEAEVVSGAVGDAEEAGIARLEGQRAEVHAVQRGDGERRGAVALPSIQAEGATSGDIKGPDDFGRSQGRTGTVRSEHAQHGAVQGQRRGIAVTVDHRVSRWRGLPVADFETAARVHDQAVGVLGRIGAG